MYILYIFKFLKSKVFVRIIIRYSKESSLWIVTPYRMVRFYLVSEEGNVPPSSG